jgi:hypothetical protein
MKHPKQIRNVDAEITHWSDDISGEVVLEIVTALRKRLRRVDRSHDIPYLAGYSRDGRTVFIDPTHAALISGRQKTGAHRPLPDHP